MVRRTGKIRGAFSRMHRALDGWILARAPASPAQGFHQTTMDLGILISLIFVRCVALRNLELLIKTGWNELFVRFVAENAGWSWVGDNNPSRSRLLSIILSKGGLMNRFGIGRCHRL